VVTGNIKLVNPAGFVEAKKHYGGMKYADPHPFTYPTVTAEAKAGVLEIRVTTPSSGPTDVE